MSLGLSYTDACNNIMSTCLQCLFYHLPISWSLFDTNYLFTKGTTCHVVIGSG